MKREFDLIVVGSGIMGLAQAYVAAKKGKAVLVLDRSPRALGASIRNFGMIWPVGQPAGERLRIALRSREIWGEILDASPELHRAKGSIHASSHDDETRVLREFAEAGPALGFQVRWLSPEAALQSSPALRAQGLQGALESDSELTVDPRQVLLHLPGWLQREYGVAFQYQCAVSRASSGEVHCGLGTFYASQITICSGDDFETLYPDMLQAAGITRVKLQMLRTPSQPDGWQMGPSIAAGLTLTHYKSFDICASLPALKARVQVQMPEYVRWGIHVMASQTADGAITIGDSHEYGLEVAPFNREEIDDLILKYLDGFATFPDRRIAERWFGVYAKQPKTDFVDLKPEAGVRILTSPGGAGMTLSFGIADLL